MPILHKLEWNCLPVHPFPFLVRLELTIENLLAAPDAKHLNEDGDADILTQHVRRAVTHHDSARTRMEAVNAVDVVLVRAVEETDGVLACVRDFASSLEVAANDPVGRVVEAGPATAGIVNRIPLNRAFLRRKGSDNRFYSLDPQIGLASHLFAQERRR